ncbi:MAG: hypothetical protein ACJ74O_16860 [Frankiaceae bacterium]
MHLRANMFSIEPGRLDELIRHIEEQVLPVVKEQRGNRGLAMDVDRTSGQCAIVTFWDGADAMRSTDARLSALHDRIHENYGAPSEVIEAEVLGMHVRQQPMPGCWNRVSMIELASDDIDVAVETFNTSTLPGLDAMDGFCAALLCGVREHGRAVAVTTWRDREALQASTERANALREEARDKTHGKIASVMELEVVIATMTS